MGSALTSIALPIALLIMVLVFGGFLIIIAAWVLSIVLGIIAAIKANKGEYYQYPIAINFVS